MNRRDFLKAASAAIAAAALPKLASTADAVEDKSKVIKWPANIKWQGPPNQWAEFEPGHLYGNYLLITYEPPKNLRDQMVQILYDDMVKVIPPPYRDRVEIVGPVPTEHGCSVALSWRYEPAMAL